MKPKPKDLIYGIDDKPNLAVSLLLGLQHVFTMSSTLVLPVVIAREIGVGFDVVQSRRRETLVPGSQLRQSPRCHVLQHGSTRQTGPTTGRAIVSAQARTELRPLQTAMGSRVARIAQAIMGCG